MASELETFLRLTIPEPTVILGQELLPLSIGHLLHLELLGLYHPNDPNELVAAIIICSRTTDDILPTFQDRWLELKLKVWLFRAAPFRKIKWAAHYKAFDDHIKNGTETPSIINLRPEGGSSMKDSGTPFLQHLKATLQAHLNYSPDEAMNCPFVQGMWDYYAYHESEGGLTVCDREHRKEMREQADANHDELIAEALKTGKANDAL